MSRYPFVSRRAAHHGPIAVMANDVEVGVSHQFDLPVMCPVSQNPRPGSTLTISYEPELWVLEVVDLLAFVHGFVGGRDDVESMEQVVGRVADAVQASVLVGCVVLAELVIDPGQRMVVRAVRS